MVRKTIHKKRASALRKTAKKGRKLSKGASSWNKKVMEVYREMKAKNPETKLRDAMKRASQMKKAGTL
jgi:hypothetical protein